MPVLRHRLPPEARRGGQGPLNACARVLRASGWAGLLALAACATRPVVGPVDLSPPQRWQAALPHGGDPARLADWWRRLDDPLLVGLIDEAQLTSPGLQAALARIDQSRALARAAGAALSPTANLNSSVVRTAAGVPPLAAALTSAKAAVDAAWEIDLFGKRRAERSAAIERVGAREAEWHEARVSLAAEVASTYVALRTCEALVALQTADEQSLRQTVSLTQRKVDAGLAAPADAALLRASLANSASLLTGQRGECDVLVKSLVALSGSDEATLRERLRPGTGRLPPSAPLAIDVLPAKTLAQRPDLAAIERELAATAAEVDAAHEDRYPQLTLTGSIGLAALRFGGNTFDGTSWSFGPALSLPVFDAGRRDARVDATVARFDELAAQYRQRARGAVREVEEALVRANASRQRQGDAQAAVVDFEAFLAAAQSRWQVGAGNLIELEEARRQALNANAALVQLQRDSLAQSIQLYKAAGGGWSADATAPAAPASKR